MKKEKTVFDPASVRRSPVPLLVLGVFLALSVLGCKNKAGLSYGSLSKNTGTALQVLLPESAGTENAGTEEVPAPPVHVLPPSFSPAQIPEGAIVDIKEKLFIAQTNDVYLNPDDYLGKGIRLEGLFKREGYTGKEYCFVIRYGPGCCGTDGNAGFEVAWEGDGVYPDIDDWVEATGVLKTYDEDGYPYLYIALSSLTVMDERGAEFVSQ
ncbi:MAG: hypothetical protein LBK64_04645 [Spirochaetaceae bacterium]|nr:hypothetical protein [Spirochaetaceae bacterium]